jgi:putative PIN family toxin of toxin-antitoxin system
MKIVLDTNVYIAALLSRGLCAEVYQHCLEHQEIILSDYILKEIQKNLVRKLGQSAADTAEALEIMAEGATRVTPQTFDKPICRDSSDDPILGTAVAGMAQYIVTGDDDLLSLKHYKHIRIISPRDFWARVMNLES